MKDIGKGFRTLLFNVLMGIIAIVALVSPETEMPSEEQVTAAVDGVMVGFTILWSAGNIALRWATTTPIFNKEES